MIPRSASITLARLDPELLVIDDRDHAEPVDPWAVGNYVRLLTEQTEADTDPVLVLADSEGRLRVRRGRHRVLANRAAGRSYVLAMVYQE